MKPPEEFSKALPPEAWSDAAARIAQLGEHLARLNAATLGKEGTEALMTDIQLAYMAMMYVAEHASDKCRFIIAEDSE